jgi:hypothetical protein
MKLLRDLATNVATRKKGTGFLKVTFILPFLLIHSFTHFLFFYIP